MLMRTHEIIIRNDPGVTSLRFGGGYDDLDFEKTVAPLSDNLPLTP